jgi:predicted nucleotidyltransferase
MLAAETLQCLREAAPDLRRRFAVSSLSVFGSMARGDASEHSDVDILVEFERPVGLFDLARLRRHLVEILGRPVDLGTSASLRPRLRRSALDEAIRVA